METEKSLQGAQALGTPLAGAYLIGELASLVGMEPETVRFYESQGLIEPKRIGRLRLFTDAEVERLKLIKTLRNCGVSVKCIRAFLEHHNQIDLTNPPPEVKAAIESGLRTQREKLERLEAQFKDLLGKGTPREGA